MEQHKPILIINKDKRNNTCGRIHLVTVDKSCLEPKRANISNKNQR